MTLNTRMIEYLTEKSGVVYKEQCKGPNTLFFGTPYYNKLGCDFTFEVTTTWDRPERNAASKLRAVDETPN